MKYFYQNKFLFWNLIALIVVKAAFSFSGVQFASLLNGIASFTKEEVVQQTNATRLSLGFGELKENPVLDAAAAEKLQDMINSNYFAHTSPAGVSPWFWIEKNKYSFDYAGENLALGFSTAKETVDAWINSPSHRENLLNANYREIGIAVAPARIEGTDGVLVVQLFGTPKPTKTAVVPAKTVAKARPITTTTIKSTPPPVRTTTTIIATTSTTLGTVTSTTGPAAKPDEKRVVAAAETPAAATVVEAAVNSTVNGAAKTLNGVFIAYALIMVLLSAALIMFMGARKELVIRAGASLALFALAIIIPFVQIGHKALISSYFF